MIDSLAFYRDAAPMTAIDTTRFGDALGELPREPRALAEIVRGLLIHRDWAPMLGVDLPPERFVDQHIRPVNDVITRVLELSPAPLATPRPSERRMVGVCRHFTVLHVALLRAAGVPARARAGFASYFDDSWADHWITEWWDGSRWVRHDAQVGAEAAPFLKLPFDPADQPPGAFLTGSAAWARCRAGDDDPRRFGIFDMRGYGFIRGDLRLDLAALNKVELLPWDGWGVFHSDGWVPEAAEGAELDRIAEVVMADDLERIRAAYAEQPVPRQIVSFMDGVPTPVTLDVLVT